MLSNCSAEGDGRRPPGCQFSQTRLPATDRSPASSRGCPTPQSSHSTDLVHPDFRQPRGPYPAPSQPAPAEGTVSELPARGPGGVASGHWGSGAGPGVGGPQPGAGREDVGGAAGEVGEGAGPADPSPETDPQHPAVPRFQAQPLQTRPHHTHAPSSALSPSLPGVRRGGSGCPLVQPELIFHVAHAEWLLPGHSVHE